MKSRGVIGVVLSFDPAEGGVLRAVDDGRRYRFGAADWQGKTEPAPGAAVDFEPDGDQARALLPVPAATRTKGDNAAASFLAARPGLPIALLMLVACVFPFLTLGTLSATMFNIVSVASSLGDYAPLNVNMETGLWLFHFLYIVPAAALVLAVLEWLGRAGRWTRIGIGLVGLIAPVAIALGARALFTPAATGHHHLGLGARILRRLGEAVAPDLFVPHIGMGWIALALLSLALVCIGIFWPAKAAPGGRQS
jgi:hypothetical protein